MDYSKNFIHVDAHNRLFRRGKAEDKVKTSVRMHKPIHEALKKISERSGEDLTDLITDIIDQYLTVMVLNKKLPMPKLDDADDEAYWQSEIEKNPKG